MFIVKQSECVTGTVITSNSELVQSIQRKLKKYCVCYVTIKNSSVFYWDFILQINTKQCVTIKWFTTTINTFRFHLI